MAATRIWIIDGHNMIFAIPHLKWLQVAGRLHEARQGLVDRLRPFAQARGEKVLVVFDGIDLRGNPDAIREPLFEAVYARRSDGVADDRIFHEARTCLEQKLRVTVVTNDVRTLAGDLPKAVQHLKVLAFWEKYIQQMGGQPGKRIEGDFSDVEREMEALAFDTVAPPPDRTGKRTAPSSSPVTTGGVAATPASERLKRKKEKGRLRQERRLKKRAEPGRRR